MEKYDCKCAQWHTQRFMWVEPVVSFYLKHKSLWYDQRKIIVKAENMLPYFQLSLKKIQPKWYKKQHDTKTFMQITLSFGSVMLSSAELELKVFKSVLITTLIGRDGSFPLLMSNFNNLFVKKASKKKKKIQNVKLWHGFCFHFSSFSVRKYMLNIPLIFNFLYFNQWLFSNYAINVIWSSGLKKS